MNRIKTLSFPLISALLAIVSTTANAQISLTLGSNVSYRQSQGGVKFKGGNFAIELKDGTIVSVNPCNDIAYYPPGFYSDACSPGTAGFLSQGTVDGASTQRPYLVISTLQQADFIEPFQPDYVALTAAPASTLKRPLAGFRDDSALLYYNLNTTSIKQYKFSKYFLGRNYTKFDQSRFQSEVVPGVYQFVFPGIIPIGTEFSFRPVPVSAVINPMVEGFAKVNNTDRGVRFKSINGQLKWNSKGYVEMSYFKPNVIKWEGFAPDTVFSAIDTLFISMKALTDERNPDNSTIIQTQSLFPAFDNGSDTRISIPNPYINTFTVPPVFPSGLRAMVELELIRSARTGGISYDQSSRKFQIPVMVLNRYTEYSGFSLAGVPQKNILADPDKDGYNNLNEWILGSNASDRNSIPIPPTPAPFQAEDNLGNPIALGSYFGFDVTVQTETVPKVKYILQRSKNQGKTWVRFRSDDDWDVQKVTTLIRNAPVTQIQVRSKQLINPILPTSTNYYIQPKGTENHIYRVKIVLK